MLEVTMKKEFNHNYLMVKGSNKNSYALQMIMNNSIKGLIKIEIQKKDECEYYLYDITEMQSVQEYYEKEKMQKEQIQKILHGILIIIKNSESYLLEERDFVLDPQYIFLDKENFHIKLCYKEGYHKVLEEQIIHLTEFMMDKVDYEEQESVKFIYDVHQIIKEKNCTLQKLMDVIREASIKDIKEKNNMEEKIEEILMPEQVQNKERKDEKEDKNDIFSFIITLGGSVILLLIIKSTHILIDEQTNQLNWIRFFIVVSLIISVNGYAIWQILKNSKNVKITESEEKNQCSVENLVLFEKVEIEKEREAREKQTVTIRNYGGTENRNSTYRLMPIDRNIYKEIKIIEFPFFIGKLKKNANDIIESRTVSRVHGKLDKIGNKFYVTDLNSTNGTYINKKPIRSNERVQIEPGDELSFADVSYQFIR